MSNTLPVSDYSQLVSQHPCTRNQSHLPCQCSVCVLAMAKFPWQSKALLSKFVFKRPAVNASQPPPVRKQCLSCYSYIGRGLPHVCTKATKRVNQANIVKNNSRKTKARVTSSIIKHIFEERNVDSRGGTVNLETLSGKPLKVTLKSKSKTRRFDLASMMKIQTVCSMSDKTLL